MRLRSYCLWLVVIVFLRVLAAHNNSSWVYADEWFQTAEFSNLLLNGVMSFSQEVVLHMRNMTWPFILTLPLGLAKLVDAQGVFLRTYWVQVFMTLLDLGILWGWIQLARKFVKQHSLPKTFIPLSCAILLLPWFTFADSLRPSTEHAATVMAWLTLGALTQGWSFAAGVLTVGIFIAKYPAGLISLGICVAVVIRRFRGGLKSNLRFVLGLGVGLVLGLAVDTYVYGRPWESLWMYLQYNVFTGMGASVFGQQDASVYLEYFLHHWGGLLTPLLILLLPAGFLGWIRGLKKAEYWAVGSLFYLVGHLLIRHKEPRFMEPIEWMLVWAAVSEWGIWYHQLRTKEVSKYLGQLLSPRMLRIAMIAILVLNFGLAARKIWGDTWSAQQTYFELNEHLKKSATPCAIVSVRRPLSVNLPDLKRLAFGYFPLARRGTTLEDGLAERPLVWVENEPSCGDGSTVLLHLHKPSPSLDLQGCSLLASGVLQFTPQKYWSWILGHRYLSGPWYSCPPAVLSLFKKQEKRNILVREFKKLKKLPSFGATQQDLKLLLDSEFPGIRDGVMPDTSG